MPHTAVSALRFIVHIKWPIGLFSFIMGYGIVNLALFQAPAWRYALSVTDTSNVSGWVTLLSFEILQIFLFFFLLYGLAVISVKLMQAAAVILFVTNSVALYFITSYNVELDQSMIANILNTDMREAGGFMTPILLITHIALLVFSIWAVTRFDIIAPRWHLRFAVWIAGIAAFLAYTWAVSFTLLWFDQHASRLGGRILPWSYVINTIRHTQKTAFDRRDIVLLDKASFAGAVPSGYKDVVVLMVGESARVHNSSLYGYARETMPQARARGVIALKDGISCATNTIAALSCILSHQGAQSDPVSQYEPLPSYLTRFGVETIVRLNNTGTPPLSVTQLQWARDIVQSCTENCPDPKSDAALVYQLGNRIAQAKSDRVFVLLHLTGSHGPAYFSKYPQEFEKFTPVCKSVQLADCSAQELINAYDNTILFTDDLVGQVIDQLQRLPNTRSVFVYLSDHGQSLGENGFYLHGAPNAIAPRYQREIPFLLWMSDEFQTARGITAGDIPLSGVAAHDAPFHSIMGAFGMQSPVYKPQFDLFGQRP